MTRGAELYPLALTTLAALDGPDAAQQTPPMPFRVGPAVLRAPAHVVSTPQLEEVEEVVDATAAAGHLGELVEMLLVTADESTTGSQELHLIFKADVLGGLSLRLQHTPQGLAARFTVTDATAQRAVEVHIDALVAHLRARGFAIVGHEIVRADAGP